MFSAPFARHLYQPRALTPDVRLNFYALLGTAVQLTGVDTVFLLVLKADQNAKHYAWDTVCEMPVVAELHHGVTVSDTSRIETIVDLAADCSTGCSAGTARPTVSYSATCSSTRTSSRH